MLCESNGGFAAMQARRPAICCMYLGKFKLLEKLPLQDMMPPANTDDVFSLRKLFRSRAW
jgi:hypothetical protein